MFFESYVLTLAREMPVLAVSRIVRESDDRIWTIVHRYVNEARDKEDFSEVSKLAVDETAASRGHNYVTVVADSERKKVVFATPGKGAETLAVSTMISWRTTATQSKSKSSAVTCRQRSSRECNRTSRTPESRSTSSM